MRYVRRFSEVGLSDVGLVGGKNASLGELIANVRPLGVGVPDGFAVTAEGYRLFLRESKLDAAIRTITADLRKNDIEALVRASARIRELVATAPLPTALSDEIAVAYASLSRAYGEEATDVAVRSSATAEDLPSASFAGQHESFLNVRGRRGVEAAIRNAFASLFTSRAMNYRRDMGFDDVGRIALSVGVQKMVRSDRASAGVIFTLDPDSGHREMILITSSYGLGESVVQGRVAPDQFYVHKPTLEAGHRSLVWKKLGTKEVTLLYGEDDGGPAVKSVATTSEARARFSLSDDDVLTLARWSLAIEKHYSAVHGAPVPMDIEWAKDGVDGRLFVVQARPETVHAQRTRPTLRVYEISPTAPAIASGLAVGDRIGAGAARVIDDPKRIEEFRAGDVLVTEVTDPDWEPIMKSAAAIVTERGGRTSHAAIVARELGIPAVVGSEGAMARLRNGAEVTVSCAEGETGHVYDGRVPFHVAELDPATVPRPRTKIMLNVGNPDRALQLSLLPSDGVGLARMEFVFASWVGVHPLALTRYATLAPELRQAIDRVTVGYSDKTAYFVERLSEGIGIVAAAFHPRPVIVRFSDFKTNEYAKLLGGAAFEPTEENPMLGWRGASRYYHPGYKEGFLLECAAVRRVRETFGLTNLKVMIPFCRTPAEGERVLAVMREAGLVRGERELEVYVMAEIPSNILLAEEFARSFDGFSIGSNDLTQLTLGVDRDSATVAPLFDERNEAVKASCARLIEIAHASGRKVGICGQAPSDHPDFAAFLVERGIDSISLTSDSLLTTARSVLAAESALGDGR